MEGYGVRLEPLSHEHNHQLAAAAADGKLWELWLTSVPEPEKTEAYVATALGGQRDGHRLPWAVRELTSAMIVGSTRYHDIVPAIDRVEIGYTWYARRWQRSHVNTGSVSCYCSVTRSIRWGVKWSACEPINST
ncbi:MAG: GNAT family N-acetyltransferase [Gammaproteobacteria bacterium]